jgi:hypothetical protein
VTRQTDIQIRHLLPHHARRILASSILKSVARERGYRSIVTKAELKRLGFTDAQCRVPALALPIWNVFGEIANYQLRPDEPRINRQGKVVKYELPTGSQMQLDAHPRIREHLRDPSISLWISEGILKADAAISAGLCSVALLGVWNWRGTNEHGGKVALGDWDTIALNGRDVFIAFDSDVMLKPPVHAALARLGTFLTSRGAHAHFVYLPAGSGGTKVGLDDFLAAGHTINDLIALATTDLRRLHDETEAVAPYAMTPAGIVYRKPVEGGTVDIPLSNFTAQIVQETVADDGATQRGELAIEGSLASGELLPRVVVSTSRFTSLDWVVTHWGTRAIVTAGVGTKDRLREAIQRLSPDVDRRVVYEHSGWRNLPEHGWCFLHARGAIGPSGPVTGVNVALRGAAAHIALPAPPEGADRHDAVRASLALLDVAPDSITVPLLAAVYRAVLCELTPADVSVFLVGPTGVFKSELAAVTMQHFGADFDRLHLPAQWSATPNFLERICFDFKDALVVIDDFAPTGSAADIARLHATADRVLRGVGNRGGRGRMHADGSLRPDYPPRGLLLGTGEDAPRGQSLRARTVIVEVGPGQVATDRLSTTQTAGRSGILAAGLAGFIQWIATHFEELHARLPTLLVDFRTRAQAEGAHARTPEAMAHLALGWWVYLRFAVEVKALPRDEAETLFGRVWHALSTAALGQARHQASEEPAQRFIDLLGSALAGGFAHVASGTGDVPSFPEAWGWRKARVGTSPYEQVDWRPQGIRVGWLDETNLYLDLEVALAAAQQVGQASGSSIGVSPKTLAKRLHERGFLASTDREQGSLKVRRTLEGQRRRALHLASSVLTLGESDQSGQSDCPLIDAADIGRIASGLGQIDWPDSGVSFSGSDPTIGPDGADTHAVGGNGRIGGIPLESCVIHHALHQSSLLGVGTGEGTLDSEALP